VSGILLAARVLLAAVLAVAGAAKLADREHSPLLRVPGLSLAVPMLELAVAAALLPAATARWAAAAAFVLLVGFTAFAARALMRGEDVECRCFGRLSEARLGRGTLVRNTSLLALAGLAAAVPGPGPRSEADVLVAALVAVTAAGAWFARELLRRHGHLMLRLEALEAPAVAGLPVGAPAPRFEVESLSLDGLLAEGLPVALIFADAHCAPCLETVPVVAAAQRELAGRVTIATVSAGVSDEIAAAWREHRVARVGIAPDHDVALSYGIAGSPALVLVSSEGRIDAPPALGRQAIEDVLEVDRAAA